MGEIYRATDTVLGRAVAVKVLAAHLAEDRGAPRAVHAGGARGRPALRATAHGHDLRRRRGRRPALHRHGVPAPAARSPSGSRAGRPSPAQALTGSTRPRARSTPRTRAGSSTGTSSPANLLLDQAGHVHVADFGIASAAGLDSHTQTGTVLGTAGYLSPEQAAGGRATPASDRYALAVVAHELLTGARPGAAANRCRPRSSTSSTGRSPATRRSGTAQRPSSSRPCARARRDRAADRRDAPQEQRPALVVAVALVAAGALAALLTATIGAGNSSPPPPTVVDPHPRGHGDGAARRHRLASRPADRTATAVTEAPPREGRKKGS